MGQQNESQGAATKDVSGGGVLMRRGDYVETWFDTGAMGAQLLYGVVIAAGPKAYRIRWESGLTNRVPQGYFDVKLARDTAEAHRVLSTRAVLVASAALSEQQS